MFIKGDRVVVVDIEELCLSCSYKVGDTGTITRDSKSERLGTLVEMDNGGIEYLFKYEMKVLSRRSWLWRFFNEGVS